ncbi:MAG: ATP-binding protein [Bernardetiaceae bacterium]
MKIPSKIHIGTIPDVDQESEILILLVDDDEEDFMLTQDLLQGISGSRYRLEWVSDYGRALRLIQEQRHALYLIDYRLGAHTGLEIIQTAIQNGCQAPLILLTGQDDRETDERALKAGASDYLVKANITSDLLERSIRYNIRQSLNLQKIRRLNAELEQRVAQRTAELTEVVDKLLATNKDLEEQILQTQAAKEALQVSQEELHRSLAKEKQVNELKSRFVSMASHEFRTPLSTILSSVSLIGRYEKSEDAPKRQKHIERIKSAVKNLTTILDDFLSISKLEEGKVRNHPEWFGLCEFLEDIAEEMQVVAKKGQQIRFSPLEVAHRVYMDKHILKNVLNNLLSNAIKYSHENKNIYIRVHKLNHQITLEIEDEGIGIPESEQTHLFTRFFRAHNAMNIQGTGLGLNIVQRYLDMMDGRITFDSQEGKGSRFCITFDLESRFEPVHTPNERQ